MLGGFVDCEHAEGRFAAGSAGFQAGSSADFGFRADSSHSPGALMEDQPVEIVGDVGQGELRLGTSQTDGADEEAEPVLLIGEDVLDGSPDRRLARIGARDVPGHRPSLRLAALDAADQHLRCQALLVRP